MRFQPTGTRVLLLAAAAMLAFGGAASAQDGDGEREQTRESRFIRFLDTNNDGKVSMEEITAEQRRLISASDVDANGTLSADEFRRRGRLFMHMRTTTFFDLMDTNGDQQLAADEIAAPSERWLKRYDGNSDGVLEAGELPERRGGRHGHHRR